MLAMMSIFVGTSFFYVTMVTVRSIEIGKNVHVTSDSAKESLSCETQFNTPKYWLMEISISSAEGMKWTPGTKNADVVDARGGQAQVLFWNITFDVNGKVSSIKPK